MKKAESETKIIEVFIFGWQGTQQLRVNMQEGEIVKYYVVKIQTNNI